jgi:hypothetical protein
MRIARLAVYRWCLVFVPIVASMSMPASVVGSTCDTDSRGRSVVAGGITRGSAGTSTSDRQAGGTDRMPTACRPACRKVGSVRPLRSLLHSRFRITGLHCGSHACRGDQAGEHELLVLPEDVNDDTTSGDPIDDDDDGRDDLNADDDSHGPMVSCVRDVARERVGPESAIVAPWIGPITSPLLTSQRLRC